jgi:hypothetical protein
MLVTQQDLDSFHRFAQKKLQNGGAESIEELFDLWRIENPTPDDEAGIHAAIRQGLTDIKAGRGRSADEVNAELRRKYNLPAE